MISQPARQPPPRRSEGAPSVAEKHWKVVIYPWSAETAIPTVIATWLIGWRYGAELGGGWRTFIVWACAIAALVVCGALFLYGVPLPAVRPRRHLIRGVLHQIRPVIDEVMLFFHGGSRDEGLVRLEALLRQAVLRVPGLCILTYLLWPFFWLAFHGCARLLALAAGRDDVVPPVLLDPWWRISLVTVVLGTFISLHNVLRLATFYVAIGLLSRRKPFHEHRWIAWAGRRYWISAGLPLAVVAGLSYYGLVYGQGSLSISIVIIVCAVLGIYAGKLNDQLAVGLGEQAVLRASLNPLQPSDAGQTSILEQLTARIVRGMLPGMIAEIALEVARRQQDWTVHTLDVLRDDFNTLRTAVERLKTDDLLRDPGLAAEQRCEEAMAQLVAVTTRIYDVFVSLGGLKEPGIHEFDLEDIVRGVVGEYAGCGVRIDIDETPQRVGCYGNEAAIRRALSALIQNAVVASALASRGSTGRAPYVCISMSAMGTERRLTIRDNGPGLPESIRQRLFQIGNTSYGMPEAFWKLMPEPSRKDMPEHLKRRMVGLGMGLFEAFVVSESHGALEGGSPVEFYRSDDGHSVIYRFQSRTDTSSQGL